MLKGVVTLRDELEGSDAEFRDILDYPDWLWFGIWDGIYLLDFLGCDSSRHYKEFGSITEQEAQSFGLDKLFTWFVIFGNRERIVDGLIGRGVENGTVYLITRRLVELLESDRRKMELIEDSTWTAASQR
ncbi:hypothetical protein [Corynebacterium sanguinis]|uniref:hypothetical protein n=1 Tax=Corynebacterium sanguinis TaxID=2594913 RepID=UPI0011865A8B|nr:hypothetical protein [Corynebacterium sanguinis]MCT1613829.1 hypothetical protein [Corynebacterium sanguinis]MCT1694671.1 hypothetical protein [Corynebacterium sanguinis]MCT1714414.1 hypothetical protein [Corynebacterium sanguinis]MCT1805435.1 hypothetical protein [Corynebacterium sanguinis]MCT2159022.1 hypothetical protein [Corynebacterium sanguinis]